MAFFNEIQNTNNLQKLSFLYKFDFESLDFELKIIKETLIESARNLDVLTFTPLHFKELSFLDNIRFCRLFLKINSKKLNINGALFQASALKNKTFYFLWSYDTRKRIYPVHGNFLNPHSTTFLKLLLKLKDRPSIEKYYKGINTLHTKISNSFNNLNTHFEKALNLSTVSLEYFSAEILNFFVNYGLFLAGKTNKDKFLQVLNHQNFYQNEVSSLLEKFPKLKNKKFFIFFNWFLDYKRLLNFLNHQNNISDFEFDINYVLDFVSSGCQHIAHITNDRQLAIESNLDNNEFIQNSRNFAYFL